MKAQYLIESSTNEWYTPHHIVASVKAVFGGGIGLDPYSCDAANAIVGATTYFTKEDDAFLSEWPVVTKVFANPPYERKVIDRCITQLIEYQRRFTTVRDFEMIVLVNAATEVGWFFYAAHQLRCGVFHQGTARVHPRSEPRQGGQSARPSAVLLWQRRGAIRRDI